MLEGRREERGWAEAEENPISRRLINENCLEVECTALDRAKEEEKKLMPASARMSFRERRGSGAAAARARDVGVGVASRRVGNGINESVTRNSCLHFWIT